jgi:hypothetical protein
MRMIILRCLACMLLKVLCLPMLVSIDGLEQAKILCQESHASIMADIQAHRLVRVFSHNTSGDSHAFMCDIYNHTCEQCTRMLD